MKYKNYKNPKTNEDKIYSRDNMLDMTLRELYSRKEELIAQNAVLGIPEEGELANSENAVYVESYIRDDGTEVRAHWRSKPHSENNASNLEIKETEPAEIYEHKKESSDESDEYKIQFQEKEHQKSLRRNDPDSIAGVKRSEPKTFIEMMQQGVNPYYNSEKDINNVYSKNCQSCNVACELIIRGFDVEACPFDNIAAKELSKSRHSAYIDPITGEECLFEELSIDKEKCYRYLENTVKKGERYEFAYHLTPEGAEYSDTESHTVFMTRLDDGKLIIYDGQSGEIAYDSVEVKSYVYSNLKEENAIFAPRILRVDNKQINPYYTNKVVRKREKVLGQKI